jgi:DNA-binding XRE family transcriptional regulator
MATPCALPVVDTVQPPRGSPLAPPSTGVKAHQSAAGTDRGNMGVKQWLYARRRSVDAGFTLPLYSVVTNILWIKEGGYRSVLRVASIHARFGRTVRALRAKAGYSQESFADATHIHRTSMGILERGEGNPRLDTIMKIARGLDMSLSELFVAMEKDSS